MKANYRLTNTETQRQREGDTHRERERELSTFISPLSQIG